MMNYQLEYELRLLGVLPTKREMDSDKKNYKDTYRDPRDENGEVNF